MCECDVGKVMNENDECVGKLISLQILFQYLVRLETVRPEEQNILPIIGSLTVQMLDSNSTLIVYLIPLLKYIFKAIRDLRLSAKSSHVEEMK